MSSTSFNTNLQQLTKDRYNEKFVLWLRFKLEKKSIVHVGK